MILLDTHVLVWWVGQPHRLSEKAKKLLSAQNASIIISTMSVWEIYLLVKKGRLELMMDTESWFNKIEAISNVRFVNIDRQIAAKAIMLPEPIHKDPADRIIIATALVHGAKLLSKDEKIHKYPHVKSIW